MAFHRLLDAYGAVSAIENALYPFQGLGRCQMVIARPRLGDELTVRSEAGPAVDRAATKAAVVRALREAIRVRAEVEFVDTTHPAYDQYPAWSPR